MLTVLGNNRLMTIKRITSLWVTPVINVEDTAELLKTAGMSLFSIIGNLLN